MHSLNTYMDVEAQLSYYMPPPLCTSSHKASVHQGLQRPCMIAWILRFAAVVKTCHTVTRARCVR